MTFPQTIEKSVEEILEWYKKQAYRFAEPEIVYIPEYSYRSILKGMGWTEEEIEEQIKSMEEKE